MNANEIKWHNDWKYQWQFLYLDLYTMIPFDERVTFGLQHLGKVYTASICAHNATNTVALHVEAQKHSLVKNNWSIDNFV